ncbi:hypothetical protein [Streptomyces gobiensis]|uniref:hypothetical protein n=1 Tax=Streptomyces gobiensis TaxID=2875706 RepID=UPI001E634342|nr:hypothetical protein [Streptomyces gobiensis]UGY94825.1 hypothetical protein test1122_25880 [Streptomyces gobiensis]
MSQQQEASEHAMTTRIGQAVILHRGGDREEARNRLAGLWQELGTDGDLLHRCTVAHYMADTQEDPEAELEWDLRALAAADALAGEQATGEQATGEEQALVVRSFYPSLYLSLAADHLKLRDGAAARRELDRTRGALGELGELDDDEYGAGIQAAIERLERRLGEELPQE